MAFLNVKQEKGDPDNLDGRLIVYAFVDLDIVDQSVMNHPLSSMVHNGILAAQGNYREQSSLKDFLQDEMGISLEDGLDEFIEHLDGIEGALDPQKLRDKLHNLDDMKDFIPTPAKMVTFHSTLDMMAEDADIFCVGKFKNIANANLSVNSFPILYQACYREHEIVMVRDEIDSLISQIEHQSTPIVEDSNFLDKGVDVRKKLISKFIPDLLYSRKESDVFTQCENQLRTFLSGYTWNRDIDSIVDIIKNIENLGVEFNTLLELYATKIAAVASEEFGIVETLNVKINNLRNRLYPE